MPTDTVVPTADGTDNAWSLQGTTKASVLTDSNDGNYVYALTAVKQCMVMSNLSGQAGVISSVTHNYRIIDNGEALRPYVKLSGSFTYGTQRTAGGAWTNYSEALAKPGGGSWGGNDADNMECGVEKVTAVSQYGFCSEMSATVVWTPPSGGFVFFLFQWLGPLVAIGLADMPKLASAIHRLSRSRVLIRPDEYAQAWRDLRDYRAPRHWFRPAGSAIYQPAA